MKRARTGATPAKAASSGVPVVILYFAVLRETAGLAQERFRLPRQVTVAQVFAEVARRRKVLARHLPACRLAKNGSFVSGRMRLQAGDELAILPPVAGG
ncbi:MAG TPA: MoaD/ThiS family protein [Planctomycetota bacterium]|nr:MoaD/ThiS family protein [Planctomycetota bacterium]